MAKTKRPAWLDDPEQRKLYLTKMAKKGVPRSVMRIACDYNNNQMAGAATRAGFKFADFKVGTRDAVEKALLEAQFDDTIVEAALKAYKAVEDDAPPKKVRPSATAKKKKKAVKRKRATKGSPRRAVARDEAPTQRPERLPVVELVEVHAPAPEEPVTATMVTEQEVRTAAIADIGAAADAVAKAVVQAPTPPQPPKATLPRRFIAEVIDADACRCPVPGKSLGREELCNAKPVVYSGLCEYHATMLHGNWRKKLEN